jgi:hypothetical protein
MGSSRYEKRIFVANNSVERDRAYIAVLKTAFIFVTSLVLKSRISVYLPGPSPFRYVQKYDNHTKSKINASSYAR